MKRKWFMGVFVLVSALSVTAHAETPKHIVDDGIKNLKRLLEEKSLQCVPKDHRKPDKDSYRGDDGYFTVSVNSKFEVYILDAGDSGYGFSSGNFTDIATTGRKVFLTVGDDGSQTLAIDFDQFVDANKCGTAALLDYSDGDYDATIALNCCLI